jgi:hypothetical protein
MLKQATRSVALASPGSSPPGVPLLNLSRNRTLPLQNGKLYGSFQHLHGGDESGGTVDAVAGDQAPIVRRPAARRRVGKTCTYLDPEAPTCH